MSEDQTTKLVTLAIKHALIERGVSHISIPNNVQKLPYKTTILPVEGRILNRVISPSSYLVKKAVSIIDQANRPVIISGFGALKNGEKLLGLAKKITAPIVTTFRGKGVINEDHKLYAGSHGTIGSTCASKLVQHADMLIVFGSSFSDMTQIPGKRIIQVDIDPLMIAKNYPVEIGLWGNCSELIPVLLNEVKAKKNNEYSAQIIKLKNEWIALLEKEADSTKKPIRPQYN